MYSLAALMTQVLVYQSIKHWRLSEVTTQLVEFCQVEMQINSIQ